MLPLLSTIFLLLLTSMPTPSQSLTLELIPATSSESPFYIGNLAFWDKSNKLATHSISRTLYLSEKLKATNNNLHSPVSLEQAIYVIKLGIGTFGKRQPSYKTYYLQMDTGSDMIWLQCDDCNRFNTCMPLTGSPGSFPCHLSGTCHPITCLSHVTTTCNGSHEYCTKHGKCRYNIAYGDGTSTVGFMAHETLTFHGPERKLVKINGVRFGCGVNLKDMSLTGQPDNKVAGIAGLSWGPNSLQTQLDPQSDSRFSYCLPPFDTSSDRKTYLTFGDAKTDGENMQETTMMIMSTFYWMIITDVSINNKPLKIPLGTSYKVGGGKAIIVDSGTPITRLPEPMFGPIKKTLLGLFNRDPNLVKLSSDTFDLCYQRKRPTKNIYAGLPNMTIHLQGGAEFEVGPEALFGVSEDEKGKQQFCLYVLSLGEDGAGILGGYQQINHRIVFDPKRTRFLFKSQVC